MFQKYNLEVLVKTGLPLDYMSLNIDLLRFMGFWPKQCQKRSSPRLHLVLGWPIIITTFYIIFILTEIIDVYLIWGDIQSVTENLCVTFTMVNMTFKMAHFICRNQEIQQLVEDLGVCSSDWDDEDKDNQKRVLRDCVKRARYLTIAANTPVFLTSLLWILVSYCFGSEEGTKKLPLRAWYPFDVTVSPYYEIASVFQVINLCFMGYTYISFTIFYVVLIIHACGNLRVLRELLVNTRERAERRVRKPLMKKEHPKDRENITNKSNLADSENELDTKELKLPTKQANPRRYVKGVSFIDVESSASLPKGNREDKIYPALQPENAAIPSLTSEEKLKREAMKEKIEVEINTAAHHCLAQVVIFHQTILRFITELDAVFRPILTIQLVCSLLIIGQVGFQATVLSNQTEGLIKFASYFSLAVAELLLYCWYSEELNHQARLVADSAYSCDWFTSTSGFKRSLQIVMLRSQRPEISHGRASMTMSCHTCTLILKNSYSVFALLKQLGEP